MIGISFILVLVFWSLIIISLQLKDVIAVLKIMKYDAHEYLKSIEPYEKKSIIDAIREADENELWG